MEGNSFSLSGVCGRSTQSPLPRAARRRRSRGREGAVYHKIHVVGIFSAADGLLFSRATLAIRPQAPSRGSWQRSTQSPRAAPEGVARGRSATRGTVESVDLEKRVARGRSAIAITPLPPHYSPIPHAFVNPFHIICGERRGCGAKIFTNWENATPKNSQNRCARCEKIGLGLTEITEFPCQTGNCVWTNVDTLRSNI